MRLDLANGVHQVSDLTFAEVAKQVPSLFIVACGSAEGSERAKPTVLVELLFDAAFFERIRDAASIECL